MPVSEIYLFSIISRPNIKISFNVSCISKPHICLGYTVQLTALAECTVGCTMDSNVTIFSKSKEYCGEKADGVDTYSHPLDLTISRVMTILVSPP